MSEKLMMDEWEGVDFSLWGGDGALTTRARNHIERYGIKPVDVYTKTARDAMLWLCSGKNCGRVTAQCIIDAANAVRPTGSGKLCKDCYWWDRASESDGKCRRYPPCFVEPGQPAVQPVTNESDRCGEWGNRAHHVGG